MCSLQERGQGLTESMNWLRIQRDHVMAFKDIVERTQAIVTIIAVVTGGVWTYNIFIMERKNYPHAIIEQKTSHVALSERANLLRVGIEVTNTGSSKLALGESMIRIQQILPVLPCSNDGPCVADEVNGALKERERKTDRFSWPVIAERKKNFEQSLEIEPGEKDNIDYHHA